MLTIETYLSISPGKGIGLFTKNDLLKGDIWWIRNELFDKKISQIELSSFEDSAIEFIKTYGFLESTNNWYLCVDNARFSNHSDTPNSENILNALGEIVSCVASKNINANEEILCNYRETCIECIDSLGFDNAE